MTIKPRHCPPFSKQCGCRWITVTSNFSLKKFGNTGNRTRAAGVRSLNATAVLWRPPYLKNISPHPSSLQPRNLGSHCLNLTFRQTWPQDHHGELQPRDGQYRLRYVRQALLRRDLLRNRHGRLRNGESFKNLLALGRGKLTGKQMDAAHLPETSYLGRPCLDGCVSEKGIMTHLK